MQLEVMLIKVERLFLSCGKSVRNMGYNPLFEAKVEITYTLILFIRGEKIEIPKFETGHSARLAGIFLQTLRDDVVLFELKEMRTLISRHIGQKQKVRKRV